MVSVFRFLASHKRIFFRKSILVALPLMVIGAYAVHEANGNSGGVIGDSKAGCSCHGAQSANTVVTISTASTQIVAGQTYIFEFSVANPSEKGAGCDISVDNGAVLGVDGSNSGLQYVGSPYNELTHTSPRAFTGDSAVWMFKYTAPTKTGTAHIYAAGNAVNLNGTDDDGDHWNTTVYSVNVVAPSGPQISAPAIVRDTVLRGDTVQTSFWVKNAGDATLDIDHYALKLGTVFSIIDSDSTNHSIAVGDSAPVTVQFIASGSGTSYRDTVFIYSNDELTPISSTAVIGVVTSGVFHLSANPTNFGKVGLTHSDTMTVTISNTGNGLLVVTPNSLSLSNMDFSIISVKPENLSYDLAPKGTVVVTVAFTPSKLGGDTATFPLTVSQYEGNTIDMSIVLIGTGVQNSSVDAESTSDISVAISPNLSQGIFNVSTSGMTGPADVEVSDPAGRIVAQEEITLGSELAIDISGLPSGIYFLAVKPRDGQSFVRRIVIEK
jgi:hypothetical protein